MPSGQARVRLSCDAPVASPYSIPNLQANTTYDIYIRDICSGIYSTWLDTSFTTSACPLVTAAFTSQSNLLNVNFNATNTDGS
ncbi:MAG: hypothetical protein U5L96_04850 [Owenweeksia sp.]|nr:hypothetical protein [Owenweeksia sp.]